MYCTSCHLKPLIPILLFVNLVLWTRGHEEVI
uniref:Uncharacterized protein n=1 Tax=Rhizophora mucronata TaxID=61149 RepID=A0A2P2NB85_RHIMU